MDIDPKVVARFWAKVDKSGGPEACWLWMSTRIPKGYGQLYLAGKQRPATHVSLAIAGRPVGAGQMACHHCDNPPCVNPAHLFVGTNSDNVMDAWAKGRGRSGMVLHPERAARGQGNASALLTEVQVLAIRAEVAAGATHRATARKYGVSEPTVQSIAKRRNWGWLPSDTQ